MALDQQIRELATSLGADFCGAADLTPARAFIEAQGSPIVAEYPRAVSVGVRVMDALVDLLAAHRNRLVAMNFRHHAYDVVNLRLDQLTARLGSTLQAEGFRAFPVPASQTIDDERLCSIFSHKLAAHLAGLGWIGKNCTLVTPQAGPRVRWATVLTDAPLTPGQPMEEQCGSCRECVDACPPQAFTGEPFRPADPRDVRFDAHACRRYHNQVKEEIGLPLCGMCVYSCPHGQG